jgi:uncharacterized membrane protein
MAGTAKPVAASQLLTAGSGPASPTDSFVIQDITSTDLIDALRSGWADFKALPSHLIFLAAIYPIGAFVLAQLTAGYDVLPLFFPLVAGFAIVGPFAAIGLYDISRRRELGLVPKWADVLGIGSSPSRGAILALGFVLVVIFGIWMITASWLYGRIMGATAPESVGGFINAILTTNAGWALILVGHVVGFFFAVAAFTISVVSFPLLLDRPAGAGEAIRASIGTVKHNPRTMALWAAIIAAGLMAGSALVFVGLVVVLPVLAHASWHLYRKAVHWR